MAIVTVSACAQTAPTSRHAADFGVIRTRGNILEKKIKKYVNSSIKVGDFLVSAGASFVPGGSIAYDGLKKLLQIGKEAYDDRIESKIHDFHMAFLNGEFIDDDYMNKDFSSDDYYLLLNSCIQDIEEEKADLYGTFLKKIIQNGDGFSKIKKQRLLTIFRDLTLYDLDLLRKLFIYSHYPISRNKIELKEIFNDKNEDREYSLNKLESLIIINKEENKLTKIGIELLNTIFSVEELKPESLGLKEWNKIRISIISFNLDQSFHREITTKIETYFFRQKIKSTISSLDKRNNAALFSNVGILIIDDELDSNNKKMLEKFMESKPLWILDFESKNDFSTMNVFRHISIDLNNIEQSLKNFYNEINKVILDN